jgi:hypothetical protein
MQRHKFLARGSRDVNPRSQFTTVWLDIKLDRKLVELAWRISHRGGDRIGEHYLEAGSAEYAIYQTSRCPRARCRAWKAVSRGFRWIEHLGQGWTS